MASAGQQLSPWMEGGTSRRRALWGTLSGIKLLGVRQAGSTRGVLPLHAFIQWIEETLSIQIYARGHLCRIVKSQLVGRILPFGICEKNRTTVSADLIIGGGVHLLSTILPAMWCTYF